jgi:hypothetical protein
MTWRRVVLACVALLGPPAPGFGQTMVLSAGALDLPTPDGPAYDAGASLSGSFSVAVTECAGPLGCRVLIEDPNAASAVPIALEWRLVSVGQTGEGEAGCVAMSPLFTWQDLPASPAAVMDTGVIAGGGPACVAALDVRATTLSYSEHQYTSPVTTYWREVLLRALER